jgi:hypothetical protein
MNTQKDKPQRCEKKDDAEYDPRGKIHVRENGGTEISKMEWNQDSERSEYMHNVIQFYILIFMI